METASHSHPVVEAYRTSDHGLRAILDALKKQEPASQALLLLDDFINGKQSANGAFLAARQVDIRGLDGDFCILFLSTWAQALFVQSAIIDEKREAAWTLIHRARALIAPTTPPEVTAALDLVTAHLVGTSGNRLQQETTIKKALAALHATSPRRKDLLLELGHTLALTGRLTEIESDLRHISPALDETSARTLTALRFVDHVETGRLEKAGELIDPLAATDLGSRTAPLFRRYRTLLEIMQGATPPDINAKALATNQSDLPDWALVLECLLSGSIHQALRWARWCEKNKPEALTSPDCLSFNLIRAELAEANIDAAKRLLTLRGERGNRHYLDDLFLARMAWLENDPDTATTHFAKLLKAVDAYHATGRLDFELRLASDIPREALLYLTRTSHALQRSQPDLNATAPSASPSPQEETKHATGIQRLIGSSRTIATVRDTLLRFADLDVPVLITGETGTGKELAAHAIHESGPRRTKPFVAINCGAISDSLLESELFGHEKGAFSGAASAHQGLFEEAADGTIFLDEIGDISPRLQVVLLRVLETNEIRPVGSSKSRHIACRIITSTNADLTRLTQEGAFRQDLLFRLRRLEIHLPPLRERQADILEIAQYYLNLDRPSDSQAVMSEGLKQRFRAHSWPGNVRELRNVIEKMRLMNSDKLYYEENDSELPDRLAMPLNPVVPLTPPTAATAPPSPHPRPQPGRRRVRPVLQRGRSRVRRLTLLRELFSQHKLLTRNEIVKTLEISPNTATEDLKMLCREGWIDRVAPTASPRSVYFVLKEN